MNSDSMAGRAPVRTKYSDLLARWLVELGYTHCFYVAGGHIMHLLESCSRQLTCIPMVHEVAAGIAAEYFNEVHLGSRAFALVTSGPGLTNILTALAGAYLEGRELLVIGGQVKTADLARGLVRQRGIQEIDGVALAAPVTACAARMESPLDRAGFVRLLCPDAGSRKAPVFLEVPLDLQAAHMDDAALLDAAAEPVLDKAVLNQADRDTHLPAAASSAALSSAGLGSLAARLARAQRPVLLLGGGIGRDTAELLLPQLSDLGIPIMLTWNAADRLAAFHPLYFGRPNTWGQRHANILLQQADLLLALGTRLGLQQTGFCWQRFVPAGEIVQVDCDPRELAKGHPRIALGICADANQVLAHLCSLPPPAIGPWLSFCRDVRQRLPLVEPVNRTGPGFVSPYCFVEQLSCLATEDDIVIPCSSGSAFTVMMQAFAQKAGQRIVTNKGLASMGYGLGGAIGAAFAGRGRRTLLVEGDGGFMQNLQELGTVAANRLNLKIFLFDDHGYASIRMTQKNYFGGRYVGCDIESGLGMPCWATLFAAYGIPVQRCGPDFYRDAEFLRSFAADGPAAYLVQVDPEQTYYPKIASRLTASGGMESEPLHLMTPKLDAATAAKVFRYLPDAFSR